ncbi:hypothetical protein HYU13_01285 [Candidatus Woesearchaeota archaeon]|nr:hypothetical protein [Candidatus Woesearchaeota archaeon]
MALGNKKIVGLIGEIGGDQAISVIDYIKDKKNVSEFIIADKLKLDMQTTRNILYNLNSYNVATYIRKKDRTKGWYISYWTFNRKRAQELVSKVKRDKLIRLRDQLKKEESNAGNFYICKSACARLDFDQATEFGFKCPECGSLLNLQDNSKTIENIKMKIEDLEKDLQSNS